MGYFRSRFKAEEKNGGFSPIVLKFEIIWLGVVAGALLLFGRASSSSVLTSREGPSSSTTGTTTSRAWPNHDFFLDVISTGREQMKTSNEETTSEVNAINPLLIPSTSTARSNTFGNDSNPDDMSPTPVAELAPGNESIDIDSPSLKHDIEKNPLVSTVFTQIPLLVIDNRKYRYLNKGTNHTRTYYGGGLGFNSHTSWQQSFKNGSPTPNSQLTRAQAQLPKTYDSFPTAPSIPLFTGPTEMFDTGVESPLRIPSRHSPQLPLVNWGLGEIRITSTAPKIKEFSSSTSTLSPNGSSFKSDIEVTFPPIPSPTTTTQYPLPPIAEPRNETSQHITSDLLFKIWTYTDEGLKLESERVVPLSILQGQNVSDGQVLNIEHIPLPMKKVVESAFNVSNSVIKRHSGPGSSEAFHWQQLPFGVPLTSTVSPPLWNWMPLPKKTVNYIVWSTTTTPRPDMFGHVLPPSPPQGYNYAQHIQPHLTHYATPSSSPPRVKDSAYLDWLKFQEYLQSQVTNFKNTNDPQKNENNQLLDKDILASVASMALILSKINKDITHFSDNSKVTNSNVNGGLGLNPTPITRDQVWSSLLPIFLHHLKYGQSPSTASSPPFKTKTSTNSPLWNRDSENAHLSGADSTGYSFYPQQNSGSVTTKIPSRVDDPYKTNIFKVVKKKIKRLKNKRKSKKHSVSTTNFNTFPILDPDNPDLNYSFGLGILGTIQRIFNTALALKVLPLIILTFLTFASLAFVLLPKILKGLTLWDALWRVKKSLSHHLHRLHHHHHGWAPHHNHHGWAPHHNHHGWAPHHNNHYGHGKQNVHHHFYDRGSKIDILEDSISGDGINDRVDLEHGVLPTEAYPLYDTDLDTAHNRKVMEILMETKNATLQKLLESWELNSPFTTGLAAFTMSDADAAVESQQRKRRKKK